jgi:hypothetical protein
MHMEARRLSLLIASGAAMGSPLGAQARSNGRRRLAKAMEGADNAVVLQAATPKAVAPSKLAEMASHVKSRCQC